MGMRRSEKKQIAHISYQTHIDTTINSEFLRDVYSNERRKLIRKRKKLVENASVNIPAYPQNDTEESIGKWLALAKPA